MTFRVSYMTGECWETFRDGFTCSVFEILDSHWLCDEVATMTTDYSCHRWPKRNLRVCTGKIEFET